MYNKALTTGVSINNIITLANCQIEASYLIYLLNKDIETLTAELSPKSNNKTNNIQSGK